MPKITRASASRTLLAPKIKRDKLHQKLTEQQNNYFSQLKQKCYSDSPILYSTVIEQRSSAVLELTNFSAQEFAKIYTEKLQHREKSKNISNRNICAVYDTRVA